jgi:hypothetical protein
VSETHQGMWEAVIAWAKLVLTGDSVVVVKGGMGATEADPIVSILPRGSQPDSPIEEYRSGDAITYSQIVVTSLEVAATGGTYPGDIARKLGTAWTTGGASSAPLRAAMVAPVGSAGSYVDSNPSIGGASFTRRTVVTLQARHRVGWTDADGGEAEITTIDGTITGDPSGSTSFAVAGVPVLQVGESLLLVGPSALELSP